MKADVLLGLQWGDEGKGKIVDVPRSPLRHCCTLPGRPQRRPHPRVRRPQACASFHTFGYLRRRARTNVIGNGVVLDPVLFMDEARALEDDGVKLHSILNISRKAHLILPHPPSPRRRFRARQGKLKNRHHRQGHRSDVYRQGVAPRPPRGRHRAARLRRHLRSPPRRAYRDPPRPRRGSPTPPLAEAEKRWMEAIEYLASLPPRRHRAYGQQCSRHRPQRALRRRTGHNARHRLRLIPFVTSSNTVAAGACTGLGAWRPVA